MFVGSVLGTVVVAVPEEESGDGAENEMDFFEVLDSGVGIEEEDYFGLPTAGSREGDEEENENLDEQNDEKELVDELKHINIISMIKNNNAEVMIEYSS